MEYIMKFVNLFNQFTKHLHSMLSTRSYSGMDVCSFYASLLSSQDTEILLSLNAANQAL